MSTNQSRRTFLKATSALSITGVAPFAMNLAAIGNAAAQTAGSDYKAIVCLFLFGGNDQSNTVMPFDATSYASYYNSRSTIALAQSQMTQINPTNITDGRQFALHSSLAPLATLFESGKAAVLANVGPLIVPTTKADYNNKKVPVPAKLFSHNDQQSTWQADAPEGAKSGWGGRIGDLLQSNNGSPIFTCVSAAGNTTLLAGQQVIQYPVGTNGSTSISATSGSLFGSSSASALMKTMITGDRDNLFEKNHTAIVKRSIDANVVLSSALASAPSLDLTPDVANMGLAKQLRIVARMIAARSSLGAKRQVYFVSLGGFDTHDFQLVNQAALFDQVSKSLNYFYNATVSLGVQDQVTTFTASDFGRTLASNGDGSDHGWGSHHFVMGGAVKGKQMYGTFPTLGLNVADDVGSGRLIPTTSVEQYAATLGAWMGLSPTQLIDILPNLQNFTNKNLGFV